MKKEISCHQSCVLVVISILTLKLLSLPSYFYLATKNTGFVSLMGVFVCDFLMFLLFLLLKNKYNTETFYEMCKQNFGKIIAKIVFFCVFLLLFLKFLLIMWESYSYFRETIFERAPFYLYFILIVTMSCSLVLFGFKSFARTSEFTFYLISFGLISSLLIVIFTGNFSTISPIFSQINGKTFQTSFDYVSWFGDYAFLFLMMDKIKIDKNSTKKLIGYILFTLIFLVTFYIVFYKTYTVTSPNHRNAITDIIRISKKKSTVNILDWIPVVTMMFLIILQTTLFLFCLKDCYKEISQDSNTKRFLFIFVFLLLIVSFIFSYNIQMLNLFTIRYLKYLAVVVFYFIPSCLAIVDFIKRRRKKDDQIITKII